MVHATHISVSTCWCTPSPNPLHFLLSLPLPSTAATPLMGNTLTAPSGASLKSAHVASACSAASSLGPPRPTAHGCLPPSGDADSTEAALNPDTSSPPAPPPTATSSELAAAVAPAATVSDSSGLRGFVGLRDDAGRAIRVGRVGALNRDAARPCRAPNDAAICNGGSSSEAGFGKRESGPSAPACAYGPA
jgi:hypothetical protein